MSHIIIINYLFSTDTLGIYIILLVRTGGGRGGPENFDWHSIESFLEVEDGNADLSSNTNILQPAEIKCETH